MDQTPSRRNSQGRDQVSKPRVVRARNAADHSFEQSFPPVSTVNPGRAPVYGNYERQNAGGGRAARYSGASAQTRSRGGSGYREDDYADASGRKNAHPILYATVIMVCTLGLIAIGLAMAPQLFGIFWKDMPNYGFTNGQLIAWDVSRMNDYRSKRSFLNRDTIFPGVYVDNVHVGNMTIDQAREALASGTAQSDSGFSLTVNIGNRSFPITSQMVPLTRNVDQVLEQAYALGRQNTAAGDTSPAPFEQRLQATGDLYSQNVFLTSHMSYDKATVRMLTDEMVSRINRDPVDATVQTFDFNTRKFTFTDEAVGIRVDGEALYQQVTAKLDAKEYGQTITFTPEIVNPKVTRVELMNSFKKISEFTTTTTSNSNRNTNVDLSAKAINGHTVMPGEVFSFNQTTGQRTAAKGYKEAIAISGGQSVPDIGGGVCQTSGTLFNAVARADLEIVDRSPHSWPSTYVEKGMDATVNWPNLDFKFRNNKDTPIFIISYYNNRKVTVEIYGMSLGPGLAIDLKSEVVKTTRPPSDVKYVQNTSLPAGTSKEIIEARTGYVVDTYKVWYKDGQELKREKMFTSNYRAYQRTVEYN